MKDINVLLQDFFNKYKNVKGVVDKNQNLIIPKTEIKNTVKDYKKRYKKIIDEKYEEIVFRFANSIFILEDGSVIGVSNAWGEIFSYDNLLNFTIKEKGFAAKGAILFNGIKVSPAIGFEAEAGGKLFKDFQNFLIEKEREQEREQERLEQLQVSQNNVLSELDKDGNGEVDIVEGDDFNLLLKKHQKSIVEIDRNYVQQFVKVSSYLKTKKGNIQSLFNNIKGTSNQEVLNKYVEILKDEIHTYNLILFNSLNMIVSLVEDDMITFYEIHEMFDTLNMFDSQHEKNVSQRLTNIGDGLQSLMYEIRDMGNQLSNSFADLSYVTEESNRQLNEQLSAIDSSIQTNNLLTGIQTYQMYKVNKNTKSLKE